MYQIYNIKRNIDNNDIFICIIKEDLFTIYNKTSVLFDKENNINKAIIEEEKIEPFKNN